MESTGDRSEVAGKPSSTVPKFTSFKPKRAVSTTEEAIKVSRELSNESQPSRKDVDPSHRKHGKRNDHASHGARHDSETYIHATLRERDAKPKASRHSHDPAAIDLFLVDKQGDPENLVYERLHRYSVPKYHYRGRGNIIGLGQHLKLRAANDDERRLVTSDWRNDAARRKTQSLLSLIHETELESVTVRGGTDENLAKDSSKDFIALDVFETRKRRRTGSSGSAKSDSGTEAENTPHRDAIERRLHKDPDTIERMMTPDREKNDRLRLHKLSETVKVQPQNVDSWLALIDFYRPNLNAGGSPKTRDAERRAQADIKVSIYEDALRQVGQQPKRERLLLGLLNEGTKLWDSRRLANRWRQTIKENSQFPRLRLGYVDFFQSNVIVYRYEQCRDVFLETMKTMQKSDLSQKEGVLVYLFLRVTKFILDAGYSEQALGLWQAMLEFTFLRPQGLNVDEVITKFEDFWESEVARIGEERACGWKSGMVNEVEAKSDIRVSLTDNDNLFGSWAWLESEISKNNEHPARTMDDVSEDDPYRVILFSDVTEYLFQLKTDISQRNLIQAFLKFCDLPPYYNDEATASWWHDGFLLTATHRGLAPSISAPGEVDNTSNVTPLTTSGPTLDPEHHLEVFDGANDISCLLPTTGWFSCWTTHAHESSHMQAWKQRSLQLLVQSRPDDDLLAEYVVSYAFQTDGPAARKYAKALLKRRPSSLRLYNAFAILEQRLGNPGGAERVWSTALSMSKTIGESEQRLAILLWKTWIWESLDCDQSPKALRLLLAIPDGQVDLETLNHGAKPEAEDFNLKTLKASRVLESHLSHALSFNQASLAACYADCLALLRYFSKPHNQDLRAALSVYGVLPPSASPTIPSTETTSSLIKNPLIAQSAARLIRYHTRMHPHSPDFRLTTLVLTTLLSHHPSNTMLLRVHSEITKHTNLFDRLRSHTQLLIAQHSSTPPSADPNQSPTSSLIPSLYRIHLEIQRPTYGGGTQNSIRAAFEHAVSPDDDDNSTNGRTAAASAQHAPFVWCWYLDWELHLAASTSPPPPPSAKPTRHRRDGENRNRHRDRPRPDFAKALQVYYRGLRALPWHKGFAMRAFTDARLRAAVGEAELRKVYEGMVERGCRIRCDISDRLDGNEEEGDHGR